MEQKLKGTKVKGYAILPCFKVVYDRLTGECMLTCGNVLTWIFETFFVPFWTGKVHLREDEEGEVE